MRTSHVSHMHHAHPHGHDKIALVLHYIQYNTVQVSLTITMAGNNYGSYPW